MSATPEPEANDVFSRFVEMAGSPDALDAARRMANWTDDAPNPLIIVGPNGSGKTTLLRMVADSAQRSAPEKKIVWLSERVFSQPSEADEATRYMSAGDRVLHFVAEDREVLSSDMLILDDSLGMLDEGARKSLWESIARFVSRGVPVALTLASGEMLPPPGTESRDALLQHGTLIQLSDHRFPFKESDEGERISAAQAAVGLRAVDVTKLPQQVTIAPQFVYSGDGPIEIAPEDAPTETPEKVELYEDLCLKARRFLSDLSREKNQTAQLRGLVESFTEFLPRELADVKPRRLWARGNTLRRYRDADLRLRRAADSDDVPLPELVGELLSDLVDQYNVFAAHDETLRELDGSSLGPQDRADVLLQLEAGRELSQGLAHTTLIAPSAAAVLVEATEQASEAAKQPGINADQALEQALKTQRNGAIALLSRAVREVKNRLKSVEDGAWKFVGSEAAKFVYANLVRLYETQITSLLGRVQGGEVATYVLRLLRHFLGS